jgi:hypothetical protein
MRSKDDKKMDHSDARIRAFLESCRFLGAQVDLTEHAYYIMGQVALLVRDRKLTEDQERCIFGYFHTMAESEPETQNLLVVGALELLTDTPESIARTRKSLREGPAAFLFERVLKGWASAPR